MGLPCGNLRGFQVRSLPARTRQGRRLSVSPVPAVVCLTAGRRRSRRDRKMPSAENLARARSLVSSDLMTLAPSARTVRLAKPGMKLDLGGIAKGFAADEAVKVLRAEGVPRALVAGAGDIVVG